MRPGSARMIEGASADYLASGNLQSVTNDTMIERGYELWPARSSRSRTRSSK
ncbi:MAG: hypothetical protein V8S24_06575 [Gordonibacter pamelaeae]